MNFSPYPYIRYALLMLAIILLSACASTDKSKQANQADYGQYPEDYQKIINNHLKSLTLRKPLDISAAQFLNTPNKFIFSQFARQKKYGYRACVLLSTKEGDGRSRSTMSNFFLIKNGAIIEHLHDSGLIQLSDKFCEPQLFATKSKRKAATEEVSTETTVDKHGFKYIVCRGNKDDEELFVFNPEKHQLLVEYEGRVVSSLKIEKLTDTFIVATGDKNVRVSINRISGTAHYQREGIKSERVCELTSKQRF